MNGVKRVGIYDSGVGGLTVLNHLVDQYPQHDYFYFGDTAHVPYGSKSIQQIQLLSRESAKKLRGKNLDLLIVACNTISCVAIPEIEAELPGVPVVGIVEAGVTSILTRLEGRKRVLILGTEATVQSQVYSHLLKRHLPDLEVYEQACPLLVPMIEGGWSDHPVLKTLLNEYVSPYSNSGPGVALLACTHYPWIKNPFKEALPGWEVVDSADAIANQVRTFLQCEGQQRRGQIRYEFSDKEAVAPSFFDPKRVT